LIELGAGEAIVVSAPARGVEDRVDGALVLTTERLAFVVAGRVRYEAPRVEITHANQFLTQLWVFRRGAGPGIGFELQSDLAGPVRWDWYLAPPNTRAREDRMLARADDERLGAIDDTRRMVLRDWHALMSSFTVTSGDHYLDGLPEQPISWDEIVEIVYVVEGRGDGPSWMLVVRLADGRWVYYQHVVQITGEIYTTTIVARSLESLWWGAFVEEERDRVTAQMTGERLAEELVQLDALLQSEDRFVRARAEYRVAQIKAQRGL
jgi:hypothetical protein